MTKPKTKPAKRPYAQDFSGESPTQQHFRESSDVNNIVRHFAATGIDPYSQRLAEQRFGYATSQDFSEAMQNVAEIQSAFAEQPSDVRARFANDPSAWLESLTTPEPTPDENVPENGSQEPSQTPPEGGDLSTEIPPMSGETGST